MEVVTGQSKVSGTFLCGVCIISSLPVWVRFHRYLHAKLIVVSSLPLLDNSDL